MKNLKLKIIAYLVMLVAVQACGNDNNSDSAGSTADGSQQTPVDPFLQQPTLVNQFVSNEITTLYDPIILFNNDGLGLAVWNAFAGWDLITNKERPVSTGIYVSWYDGKDWSEEKLIGASATIYNSLQALSNGSNFMIVWSDKEFFNALTIDFVNGKPSIRTTKRLATSQTFFSIEKYKLVVSGSTYGVMTYTAGELGDEDDHEHGINVFTSEGNVWRHDLSIPMGGFVFGDIYTDFTGGELGFALTWIDGHWPNILVGSTIQSLSSKIYTKSTDTWGATTTMSEGERYGFTAVHAGKSGYLFLATAELGGGPYNGNDEKALAFTYSEMKNEVSSVPDLIVLPFSLSFSYTQIASLKDHYMVYERLFCDIQTINTNQTAWNILDLPRDPEGRLPQRCTVAVNEDTLFIASTGGLFLFDDQFASKEVTFFDKSLNLADNFVVKSLDHGRFGVVYRYNEQALRYQEYDPATGWQAAVEIGSIPRASYDTAMAVNPVDETVWVTWIGYGDAAGGTYEKLNVSRIKDGVVQTTTLKHIPRPPKL